MKKIKYLLSIISVLFHGSLNIFAKVTETQNREELDNLGVNKKWEITDSNKKNVLDTKLVNAEDKIYDFYDVLTEEEYEKLRNED